LQRLTQIREQWNVKIFEQASDRFEELALEAFLYQYRLNPVYRAFVEALRVDPLGVKTLEKIPFLPVSFFKTALVQSTLPAAEKETLPREAGKAAATEELVFESSGTTGSIPSIHRVTDPGLYELSFERGFARQFGPAENWCILALLPSYLERKNSSLVYMASRLIAQTKHQSSGFYLHELNKLRYTLIELEQKKQPTLLLGVSFALLDLAVQYPMQLHHTQIIETGGMKGRGPELTREELHERLQQGFGLPAVYSEYGMTELLSQAWSKEKGSFETPPWMRVGIREEQDPLTVRFEGTGALNIIDLANIDSCCFIATEDNGIVSPSGQFEVRGRIDHAELRGCSLMTL